MVKHEWCKRSPKALLIVHVKTMKGTTTQHPEMGTTEIVDATTTTMTMMIATTIEVDDADLEAAIGGTIMATKRIEMATRMAATEVAVAHHITELLQIEQ
jgi:hypothetical protein